MTSCGAPTSTSLYRPSVGGRVYAVGMDLLTALASIPPEQLVEGAQIVVTKTDGSKYVLTLGERIEADIEKDSPFLIKPLTAAR